MPKTLIFPSSVFAAQAYADDARARGEPVVAASSLAYDPSAMSFDSWFYLPSIYDEGFNVALQTAIEHWQIDRIYSPVAAVHNALIRLIERRIIEVDIVGEMPIKRQIREHLSLMARTEACVRLIEAISAAKSSLTPIEVASTLRLALGIYGESNEIKLAAIMAIFADAPQGDVIEIGTLVGRSACVLALMAERHNTGAVLVSDPWSAVEALQTDSSSELFSMTDAWHPDDLEGTFLKIPFHSFLVALVAVARRGSFNYVAQPSASAFTTWRHKREVHTEEFGTTIYQGRIAVLHIDGNHDFSAVSEDCRLWLPYIAPRGWLILDDYVWLHGDGPKRVGDAILLDHFNDIERSFVCGNALFIRFAKR